MLKPKNTRCKISTLRDALDKFEAEHGDIDILLTTDLESVKIGGEVNHFYDTIDKFCVYQITKGVGKKSKKYLCITDIFAKM